MNTIVKANNRTQIVDQVQLVTEFGEYSHILGRVPNWKKRIYPLK